jgi:hypothetical protein
LKFSVKKLNKFLENPNKDLENSIAKLTLKIKKLVNELTNVFSKAKLARIIGAASLFLGLTFSNTTNAQSFASPVENPFGLDTISESVLQIPEFADMDGDGDLDILVGGEVYSPSSGQYTQYSGAFYYFENTGTSSSPLFSPGQLSPFGLDTSSSTYGIMSPTLVDLDGDGDLDLINSFINIEYYENTGDASSPVFSSPVQNPFGLNFGINMGLTEVNTGSTLADLDGDGDFDLLTTSYYGNLNYFENIGTSTAPQFAPKTTNPFGLTPSTDSISGYPELMDIDRDGDLDLMVGSYNVTTYAGLFEYFENIGTNTVPQFAPKTTNPFGLTGTYEYNYLTSADLDNDGDLDVLSCEYYGVFQYFENTELNTNIEETNADIVKVYPNPFNDEVFLETLNNAKNIEVFDVLGKKVVAIENVTNRVSLQNLKPGLYSFKINFTDGTYQTKQIQKK